MTTERKAMGQRGCIAMQRNLELVVQRARREEGPGLAAARTAIRSGLQARGTVHRDALAGALHCVALVAARLEQKGIADLREPELVLLELATAAADLEQVLGAVAAEIDAAEPKPARMAA